MDRVFGGLSVWMQVTGYSGDFHQIIRYSASGFCLVDKCHEAKNSHTDTRAHEHTSWRRLIYLRLFFFSLKGVKMIIYGINY